MMPESDTERLRETFIRAADAITPSPVPLARIHRTGRVRRRRTAVLTAAGCALLLAPLTAVAVHLTGPAPVPESPAASATAEPAPRVAAPGTAVMLPSGARVTLGAPPANGGGGQSGTLFPVSWVTPATGQWGRSAATGPEAGVEFDSSTMSGRRYLTGTYALQAAGAPVRVEVITTAETVSGQILHATTDASTGVWYADLGNGPLVTQPWQQLKKVTFYDTRGNVLGQFTAFQAR